MCCGHGDASRDHAGYPGASEPGPRGHSKHMTILGSGLRHTCRGHCVRTHVERNHGQATSGTGHREAQNGPRPGVSPAGLLASKFHPVFLTFPVFLFFFFFLKKHQVERWVGKCPVLPISSYVGTFPATRTLSRLRPAAGVALALLQASSGSRRKEPTAQPAGRAGARAEPPPAQTRGP